MDEIFFYKLCLSLHIISFVSWMAGMLYLPRLFVYHSTKKAGSESSETFKLMEQKLLRIIMNPSMVAAWAFGLALIGLSGPDMLGLLWFQVKFIFVLILSGVHVYFSKIVKDFQEDQRNRSEKFYRIINELPTALLIIVVFLAIFKPI